ncbi:MAG: flagellar M-ring protein FliF [Rhizobiales bacterium]|nr:flagellar M-ring protein FliF [Hyphomicrobiales bacterium]
MQGILDIVNRLGPQRLLAMGAVTLALIGFFVFLVMRVSQPPMGVLFSEISMQDANTITRDLDSKGIRYETRADGATILVPKENISKLRMEFAAKGVPIGGSVGYEIFDKGDSFSATSFVQGINQLRALEGELSRTIRSLDRVQSARVHLAIPEKKLFARDAQEPRASIVLKLRGDLDQSQIRAIRHLAATAVHGLKPEKVSIVDEAGRLLADGAGAEADPLALTADKQSNFERRLKTQVEEIVASVVGRGRARVQVAAEMDFNRIQQVTDNFDPESRVVRSTQTRTENQQSAEQRDGQVTIANELPQAQQQQQNQPAPQQREQTARSEEIINYEISKTTRTEVIEGGRVKRLSVAVLVDGIYNPGASAENAYQPRSSEELERIAALVRTAIGFDRNRGDQIEVINLRFAEGMAMVDGRAPSLLEQLISLTKEDVLRLVELAIFGALTLLVTLLVIRPLMRQMGMGKKDMVLAGAGGPIQMIPGPNGTMVPAPGQMLALPAPGQESAAGAAGAMMAANSNGAPNMAQLTQNLQPGVIDQLGKIVEQNPGESIAIVRQWIAQPR